MQKLVYGFFHVTKFERGIINGERKAGGAGKERLFQQEKTKGAKGLDVLELVDSPSAIPLDSTASPVV